MTKHLRVPSRAALRAAALATALSATVAVAPAALASTGETAPSAHGWAAAHHAMAQRQFLGTVSASGPGYLKASAPADGTYAIEYVTSGGVSYWDTYVDGTELGYVGGVPGTYQTKTITLKAGGHLVQVAGPEGSGTAKVYGVKIS